MKNEDLKNLIERIAIAMERIADSLDGHEVAEKQEKPETKITEVPTYIESEIIADEKEIIEEIEEDDAIKSFLESKNIKIKFIPPEDAADDIINSLAEFLGNHYDVLKELLSKIKSNMQTGSFFTLAIKDYSQKNVSDICQFCTRLHEIAFLEQYKYIKSPKYLIKAKATTLPVAQNFFSGKWLERYVLQTVQSSVSTVSTELSMDLEFTYLINPQIILPNGKDFELDLIFHVNESFYWIEAKTGDYQQHISKYSKMSKTLGLDYKHSIMVLTDIQPERSDALTSLFSMTVYGLSQLKSGLIETIRKDVISSPTFAAND